jgi:hypothetical protein
MLIVNDCDILDDMLMIILVLIQKTHDVKNGNTIIVATIIYSLEKFIDKPNPLSFIMLLIMKKFITYTEDELLILVKKD